MSFQYDAIPRAVGDGTGVTLTTGVGAIGGGIGVRVIVDDAVVTSETDVHLLVQAIEEALARNTWPVA